MRFAFKEWAVIVDALGRGEQIVLLRKGGISEGQREFTVEHSGFLLFPTLFHQQRESVIPTAQARFDVIASSFPSADTARVEFFCAIVAWRRLESLEAARRLRGQHVWRDQVIAERFDWGVARSIHALAVRVHRLRQPVQLPRRESYGGCKSWIQLEQDISTDDSKPVLTDAEFGGKLARFTAALEPILTA